MKVLIIGGGPAGIMASIKARENGHDVTLLEKNNEIGKKLNITGKGRCNITYIGDNEKLLSSTVNNSKFLMSAINSFCNKDLVEYVNNLGVKTKDERGARVFLESDNAKELTDNLLFKMKKLGVKVQYNSSVKSILANDAKVTGIEFTDGKIMLADKVIIATGGKSYPGTGSTGDGYKLAEKLGHTIIDIKPALVGLKVKELDVCKRLQGLNLKNTAIKVIDMSSEKTAKKPIYTDFGEMLFTHFGISGPIILSSSSYINKIKNLEEVIREEKLKLVIDLKPALSMEQVYKRITADFEKYTNNEFKNSLMDLLPKSLIEDIVIMSKIDENKKVHQISKEEKERLAYLLKNMELTIVGQMSVETGIVTAGGVNVKEIDPKTMQSKLIEGLYFAGEVMDLDAVTGGFNLQIAFSTGFVAGSNV